MISIELWRSKLDGYRGEGLKKLLVRGDDEHLNPQPGVAQLAELDGEQLKRVHDNQVRTDMMLSGRDVGEEASLG